MISAGLPDLSSLPRDHALGISLGGTPEEPREGTVVADKVIGLPRKKRPVRGATRIARYYRGDRPIAAYGIVARESEDDERSPRVILEAFLEALNLIHAHGFRVLHVHLLAAGPGRAFHPWVALVQMARAYGRWFSRRERDPAVGSSVRRRSDGDHAAARVVRRSRRGSR